MYAPKSALGDSVGASGAVESVLTVLALRAGVIPPTLNLHRRDPEIDLDVVCGRVRYGDYGYAINNSFGVGGHNAALVFGRTSPAHWLGAVDEGHSDAPKMFRRRC